MKGSVVRLSTAILIVAFACLSYVHQQVQILKLSYVIKDRDAVMCELLDQNQKLIYQVGSMKSSGYLDKAMTERSCPVTMPISTQARPADQGRPAASLWFRFFNLFARRGTAWADTLD